MSNTAIYNRFIDLFLESGEDYEPYGVIVPNAATPVQVERSWSDDSGEAELILAKPLKTGR